MTGERIGVVSFVRFQLAQLRAKNGHHDFEHLCRHLARSTICARLLPATGPVQAGGDQGRDFESFVGRGGGLANHPDRILTALPAAVAGFIGVDNTKRIVFTCTLQSEALEAKIRADVTAILATGGAVDAIHAFVESDLPVARRHALQDSARSQGVDLTIHDGQAIAESVATPEQFWIAVELLSVPSDLWPTGRDIEYSTWKEQWLRAGANESIAHFQETRQLARLCCYSVALRPEMPFWHTALRDVMARHPTTSIRRRAAYEIVMTTAHSRAWDLTGAEDALASFLAGLNDFSDYGSLTDAMNVVAAAHLWLDRYSVPEDIASSIEASHERVIERMTAAMEWESPTGVLALRELLVYASNRIQHTDEAVAELADILEASKQHPLFPLDCAKLRIDLNTARLATAAQFDRLTTLLDDAVARRSGDAAAAASRRERAHALHDAGDSLNAIRQLQRAKLAWYGSGQLDQTVACLGDLADWYLELRMPLAAKYNAETACGLLLTPAGRHGRAELGDMLRRVAACDFLQGAWLKAADSLVPSLGAKLSMASEGETFEESIGAVAAMLGVVLVGARLWHPELETRMRDVLFTQLEVPPQLDATTSWTIASWSDLQRDAELDDVWPLPFSDAGRERTLNWEGIGVRWSLSYANEVDEDRIGEQLAAALQLTMAAADGRALEVMCEEIFLSLKLSSEVAEVTIQEQVPDEFDTGQRYEVVWPIAASEDHDTFLQCLVMATAQCLSTVSLLLPDALEAVLRKLFEADWWHSVLFARTMPNLDAELSTRMVWAQKRDGTGPEPQAIDRTREALSWPRGVSPRYKPEEVPVLLRRRYDAGLNSTRLTLPRLLKREDFNTAVRAFRQERYLDWQILMAVAVLAANERYARVHGSAEDNASNMAEKINYWATGSEDETWPEVSLEIFSEQSLREVLDRNMVATLVIHDLVPPRRYPNFAALRKYLAERFKYFEDDLDHDDPFQSPN